MQSPFKFLLPFFCVRHFCVYCEKDCVAFFSLSFTGSRLFSQKGFCNKGSSLFCLPHHPKKKICVRALKGIILVLCPVVLWKRCKENSLWRETDVFLVVERALRLLISMIFLQNLDDLKVVFFHSVTIKYQRLKNSRKTQFVS